NGATEKVFGYTGADMIGQNAKILMPSPCQDLSNYCASHAPKLNGNGHDLSGRRKDGSLFPMDLAVSEMLLDGRRVFTAFVRDITDRKQAEKITREFSGRLLHAQETERARLA